MSDKKKIVIIGAGISGLSAGWALSQKHEATIFEKGESAGGHIFTHLVKSAQNNQEAPIDMGVIITNSVIYPNITSACKSLGVKTFPMNLSLQATFGSADESWGTGTEDKDTSLWRRIEDDCKRFTESLKEAIEEADGEVITLREWCNRLHCNDEFIKKGLLPLLSVLQLTRSQMLDTPIRFIQPIISSGLLSFYNHAPWASVEGGGNQMVEQLLRVFDGRILNKVDVESISHEEKDGNTRVKITWVDNNSLNENEYFDALVFACQINNAKQMLGNSINQASQDLLSAFQYESMEVTAHSDPSVLSNYVSPSIIQYRNEGELDNTEMLIGGVTFNLGAREYGPELSEPLFVSYCGEDTLHQPDSNKIIKKVHFEHLTQTPEMVQKVLDLAKLQGQNNIWFAGHSTVMPGNWHEGAFVAGLAIADKFGCPPPFAQDMMAQGVYEMIKENFF